MLCTEKLREKSRTNQTIVYCGFTKTINKAAKKCLSSIYGYVFFIIVSVSTFTDIEGPDIFSHNISVFLPIFSLFFLRKFLEWVESL